MRSSYVEAIFASMESMTTSLEYIICGVAGPKSSLTGNLFFALPLVDTIMRTHFRLESVVQRLSGTGFLHTGNNAAAAVYLGVENSKGDDAATVAEVDRTSPLLAAECC